MGDIVITNRLVLDFMDVKIIYVVIFY